MLLLAIALSLPFVQTQIGRIATNSLNKQFGTHITVDKVAITIFGSVKLKGVLIMDHHNDTLISANRLQTNLLSFKNVANSRLEFGEIKADALNVHMKTYKGEDSSSLDIFVKSFDNGKPGSGKFRLKSGKVYVENGRFRLTNENTNTPKALDFQKLSGELKDFYIKGSDISADIQKLSLLDHRGLFVKNLKAQFSYTLTNIKLKELELVTAESALKGDVTLTYTREKMRDFLNQVEFDFKVDRANVSSNELNYFYDEFGDNQKFYLSTTLKGPLNNFILYNLKLLDAQQSEIIGTVNFRNLFDKTGPGFYMNGDFDRITSNYLHLRDIMPRILGKSLPPVLENLGIVNLTGNVVLTKTDLTTNLYMGSELGEATTNLSIKDFNKPDIATYTGTIDTDRLDLGKLFDQKGLKSTTAHLEVEGRGFNKQSLNTIVKGDIKQMVFNGYNYKKIDIDGRMKWPYFKGIVNSNDENLRMSFNGLVDMSKKRKEYDFHAAVDYADLALLKLIKNDTISIFKGDFNFKAKGNNLDDLAGKLEVTQLSYQNSYGNYFFEDFEVESVFDKDAIRTITINSPDIIEGRIRGKFYTNEITDLVENALGSLYANYSPNKIKPGQFLNFHFNIYDKIVGILLPGVSISKNTHLKGRINGDEGIFKLDFDSPNIEAFKNVFYNINLDVDNRNPLYNAYVNVDSMRVKRYKISDFELINITQNDTLQVRTEFKGGNKNQDFFNLNLYHTIDEENKSVVGLKKSEVNFKEYMWYLNEDDTRDNKLVFNKKLTDFTIDKIALSHKNQKVELAGVLKDSTYKDLRLSFKDVDLHKVTPSIDSLDFGGKLNGQVSFKQNKKIYEPSAKINIDTLSLNKHKLGDLSLDVVGNESLRQFKVNTSIVKDYKETFFTVGTLDVVEGQTQMDLDATFSDFDLEPLEIFLKSIFPDIRGQASGRATIAGPAKEPKIDGRLYIKNGGLKVGYLNTDYNFEQNAVVDVTEHTLYFRDMELTDTKFNTKAILRGHINHTYFKDWKLALDLQAPDNVLVLDTEDSEGTLFYGRAFISGKASISGPTGALVIKANAKSEKGTNIKIPITNATESSDGDVAYIHYYSPEEKNNLNNGTYVKTKTFNGIEMDFDFDVTPDATIDIIIDKDSGHSLSAQGYGTLLLKINTLGKFDMNGDFSVTKGKYFFKYGGIFDKTFTARPGGTIVWDGDPTRARINIEAVYTTWANPSVLLENPAYNRKIQINVVTLLTGNIMNFDPEFNIEFPNVNSVMKADLDYRLSDPNNRKTQALGLLTTGSFISPSSVNAYGALTETASGMFSNLFKEDDSKINVDFRYNGAERNPYADTYSTLGLTLNSQINDRITINGQLGVPVGGVNESVIAGNVEVQLRLNDDGSLKARVFNRENDINFLGEGIGYTQGVGISYSVGFNTFSELWKKIFSPEVKKSGDDNNSNDIPDSEMSPEYIQFINDRDKNKKKTNVEEKEPERVPDPYGM
ncbi:translocation/assembly module TamB domain-containing protein [Flavobacterium sp. C4GT6]|uniref:translocation/assembly module TamB domain-containing protein n=1 Tax=Flavobacterium sp. C4GT6 TaxID=3103818 RepID=UPI002ED4446A